MDNVNSSGTFFRQKSTQKAPRPKVALPTLKASASSKPGFAVLRQLGRKSLTLLR
jgi:hypothetical protein